MVKKNKKENTAKLNEDYETNLYKDNDLFWDDLKNYDFKISTQSLIFDIWLNGGFSPGVNRFAGAPSHGKTMQALTWAASWLEHWGEKGRVIYYDVEGRLKPSKIKASPIIKFLENPETTKQFVIRRNNVYEFVGNEIIEMIENNPDDLKFFIVFDSLDMMKSFHDQGKTLEENNKVGTTATVSNNLMKDLGPNLCAYGHHFHILSQVRANINTSGYGGKQTKMSGGWTLKHSSDLTGEIANLWTELYIFEKPEATKIEDKGKRIGHYFKVTFDKTPHDKDGESIMIPIKHNSGIWKSREIADLCLMLNFVNKKGAWYAWDNSIHETYIAPLNEEIPISIQGAQKYYNYFESNPNLVAALEKYIREIFLEQKEEGTVF